MKKHSLLILLMAFLTLSCSDNDNDNNSNDPAGELIVNGEIFPLTKGYLVPAVTDNPDFNPRRFYIALTDGTLSFENDDIVYHDNIHQMIDFNMYTSEENPGNVEVATYPLYESGPGFDFSQSFTDHSGIYTNTVVQNGNYISGDELDSDDLDGQAAISKDGNIYTITFSYHNADDTVTGSYTGPLTILE